MKTLQPRVLRADARRSARVGFSLIEVLISLTVISVAVVGVMGSITSSASLSQSNRESSVAYRAAQRRLEQIQGSTFAQVWTLFNANPADDPGGPGTAPGAGFAVTGLSAQEGDADGLAGRISFPVNIGAGPTITVMDDIDEPGYDVRSSWPTSMGRRVDNDTDIADAPGLDLSSGYLLLPVRVQIAWTGANGDRIIEVETILCPR